jgi:hypothetical protein
MRVLMMPPAPVARGRRKSRPLKMRLLTAQPRRVGRARLSKIAHRGRRSGCTGDGEMGLAGAGPADQHGVALLGDEAAAGEVVDERLVDRRAIELRCAVGAGDVG